MEVNGIKLCKNAKRLPFLQSLKAKKEINLSYDSNFLRYLFKINDILEEGEDIPSINFKDPYQLFAVIRVASELGLMSEKILSEVYNHTENIPENIIISLWVYIGKTDVYKHLLANIKELNEIKTLPDEFISLLLGVNPVIVFKNHKYISRNLMIEYCRKTYFEVNVSRKYYRVIRNYIAASEFKIYLDQDDTILTHVHENKVRLFIPIARTVKFAEGFCFVSHPNHPLYISMYVWDGEYNRTYVIEKIVEEGEKNDVKDTITNARIKFDVCPKEGTKLLLPLSRGYYFH